MLGKDIKLKAHAPAVSHLHVLFRVESQSNSGQTAIALKDGAMEGRRSGVVRGEMGETVMFKIKKTLRELGGHSGMLFEDKYIILKRHI